MSDGVQDSARVHHLFPESARNTRLHARRLIFPALIAFAAAAAGAAPAMAAPTIRWHKPVRIEPLRNGGLSAISCPTSKLCVAVDQSGYIVTSTNPTGSSHAWSKTIRIVSAADAPLTGIDCPSATLCVATDANGDVITSTHPTKGASAWSKPAHVDTSSGPDGGSAGLTGISCPTTRLCVATDGATPANVVTSTNPTGGTTAWKLAAVGGTGSVLTSVACPSATLCVAAGSQHYVSTSPTGGASAWKATGTQAGGGVFSSITCPSIAFCITAGYGDTGSGLITTTVKPTGNAASWTTVSPLTQPPGAGAGIVDAIGCTTASFCIATDSADNVFTSSTPLTGVWGNQTAVDATSGQTSDGSAISCTATMCVVVDSNGYAIPGTLKR